MPINVRRADRDQGFLLPPSVADWLPEGHLTWFVLDVVAELDLSTFYDSYREDGRGGATYDPAVILGVLLYAYCVGERSSRRIERRLVEDVAFRVLSANQCPDHATLARFRQRHEQAIAELFSQVLGLCQDAGLIDSAVISIDGTKMEANASAWSNRTRKQLAEEILAEAEKVDAEEDERFGDRRGDELPERFAPGADRRARVREALRQLEARGASDYEAHLADRAGGNGAGPQAPWSEAQRTGQEGQGAPGQHHRSRQPDAAGAKPLRPGLQRTGGGERRPGHRGRRGHQRGARLDHVRPHGEGHRGQSG